MPVKGTTTQRDYGAPHQKLREKCKPLVRSGKAVCARCGEPIAPTAKWDLGHDDTDPNHRRYTGPEHMSCNRTAGALKAAANRKAAAGPETDTTRAW